MIRYALACKNDHEFEAWFSSSADFERQQKDHLIACPFCEGTEIRKQIMAPAISGDKKTKLNPAQEFANYAQKIREKIRSTHDYVGEDFANQARAMHDGDVPEKPIYGEVDARQAKDLQDEGVPAVPLPEPFSPGKPKKIN